MKCETCGKRIWPWQRYGMIWKVSTITLVEEVATVSELGMRYWHKAHRPADLKGFGR